MQGIQLGRDRNAAHGVLGGRTSKIELRTGWTPRTWVLEFSPERPHRRSQWNL